MNTLIIYASKYGSTADCAKYLQTGLTGTVSVVDIETVSAHTINLEPFDTVTIGSSIYVGSISKKMRAFCATFEEVLLKKRVAIFICCGFPAQLSAYLSHNFSPALLEKATLAEPFGGEARLDKMKITDKLIMKTVAKETLPLEILQPNMDAFIATLNS